MKHQQVPNVSGIINSRIFCGWENQVKNFVSDASGKIKSENCVCKNKLIIFQLMQHLQDFVSGKIEWKHFSLSAVMKHLQVSVMKFLQLFWWKMCGDHLFGLKLSGAL